MTVDKAVTEAAADTPLGSAMAAGLRDMLLRPHVVVRSPAYWLVMGVYTSTYGASNLVDVLAERRDLGPAAHKTGKLVVATGAYTASSIFKDVAFAKMFSKAADAAKPVQRAVPMATYGTFLFRDALIIGAGFILPAMVAGGLSSKGIEQPTAEKVAQLATPCAMQLAITPIHLFGLNLYNTPVATPAERMKAVAKNCPEATGVRMARFFWAYGVGGLVNKALNERARAWTVERYCSESNEHVQHGACTEIPKIF